MKLSDIVKILDAEVLTPEVNLDIEVPCAFASDLISDILMCTKEPTLLLTGLTNQQVIRLADMIDIIGIVFVRGKKPPAEVIEMAKERNLPLICTKNTMYRSSGLLFNAGLRSCRI
ncbi:MAG TPA: DRTGG domain-containing protein [Candidatus Syntrophosphaera thermopropionivorans]|jgi:predicted transcriptional regulator|uniref:Transcriptional regulator n=1 Tax=Candidatus Syntrophosphaera thermopropionivorans TaxID=2593015 RepID=A0AC61QI20_9BACT|nr:DRTGG domain-containing protein [Candidatus Syntrophosphaera thermopropionivorans]MBP7932577.1 transcriptional regulator [Candidatus Syntrophosphaera sp.]NLA44257.1 transcriptional regulator [Candidatus Cloacimonadota bacterium]MBP9006248.1 transcriptional regulator [Candidatus Syntrophosphaera sp.]TDF72611.1 transcriptional regulator [Candidatus Syntrophosphaera thermopropionivorans]HNU97237.1 DRTGG domain-containing protein [Candidatus Syntrophosphaera thermopropionivorans]